MKNTFRVKPAVIDSLHLHLHLHLATYPSVSVLIFCYSAFAFVQSSLVASRPSYIAACAAAAIVVGPLSFS